MEQTAKEMTILLGDYSRFMTDNAKAAQNGQGWPDLRLWPPPDGATGTP
jgi:hypothetical protein